MKNNFIIRAITGILFVAVIVGCILWNPLAFGCLFVIISTLTIREFGTLVNRIEGVGRDQRKNIETEGGRERKRERVSEGERVARKERKRKSDREKEGRDRKSVV